MQDAEQTGPAPPGVRLETERLVLRELVPTAVGDQRFVVALLNDPGFREGIGDFGVRTLEDAGAYIQRTCRASYAAHGFGMYGVELRATGELIGLMGLLLRAVLDAPDLGFAFLAAHCRRGYAGEAGRAALADGAGRCGLGRVVAVTSVENVASRACLASLGFRHAGEVRLTAEGPELMLFETVLDDADVRTER